MNVRPCGFASTRNMHSVLVVFIMLSMIYGPGLGRKGKGEF